MRRETDDSGYSESLRSLFIHLEKGVNPGSSLIMETSEICGAIDKPAYIGET